MTNETEIFCVAHKAPLYPLPESATIIWLGQAEPPSLANKIILLNDISPQLDVYHAFLGGSAGSYAIASLLRNKQNRTPANNRRIAIISYRKFVANVSGVNPDAQLMEVSINQAESKLLRLEQIYTNVATPFLLAKPLFFDTGVYGQYALCHNAPDLLRFTAIAIEMNIISWQESTEFLSDRLFIPGGIELGIYPGDLFATIIEKLLNISMEFLKRHQPVCLDTYQRRALSFCSERLGGFLLRKELFKIYGPEIPPACCGYICTVAS